jgi:hypothetical protein
MRSVLLHGQICKVFTTPPAMIVRAVGVAAHGGDALSTEMMYGRLGKFPPQSSPVHRAGSCPLYMAVSAMGLSGIHFTWRKH